MKRTVNVKYDIDPSVTETEIIIRTNEETEFTRNIASLIRDYAAQNETERIQIESERRPCRDGVLIPCFRRRRRHP